MAILLLVVAMLVSSVTVSIVQGMIVFQLKKCVKSKQDPNVNAQTGSKVFVVCKHVRNLCLCIHHYKVVLPICVFMYVHICDMENC